MRILTGLLCTIILLYSISVAEAENINVKYDPNWISLDKRPTPKWWTDAKFGIFIHWGPYAVPSFAKVGLYSEWYWHRLKTSSHKDKQAFIRTITALSLSIRILHRCFAQSCLSRITGQMFFCAAALNI
jgi:hypothetical protein